MAQLSLSPRDWSSRRLCDAGTSAGKDCQRSLRHDQPDTLAGALLDVRLTTILPVHVTSDRNVVGCRLD